MADSSSQTVADNLTASQRARVEDLKAQRALLADPFDRIAFDNAGGRGEDWLLHLIAALEVGR